MTGPLTDLQTVSRRVLRQRRQRLLKRLPPLEAVLPGTLIERYKRCGKPGCKCAQGRGHGPKYYLSVSQSGSTPRLDYVPCEYQEQVIEYVHNYRQARDILKEICAINRELLRRRDPL
jgi:Family of unknown function (DUF6788)